MNQPLKIFIGYDGREAVVYHTMVNSIIRRSSVPVSFTPLALNNFSNYTETHTDGSNQFIYSRFLTPYLAGYDGWALFVDGDMVVLEDIKELFDLCDDSKAVMVVKHDYKTKIKEKYLGSKNEDYPRKNWSSVVLWNCGHPKNRQVTPEFIMSSTGAELHRFTWLDDDEIGELPIEWNYLGNEYPVIAKPNLVHYTLGGPNFVEFATCDYAAEWHREHMLMDFSLQRNFWEWNTNGIEWDVLK